VFLFKKIKDIMESFALHTHSYMDPSIWTRNGDGMVWGGALT
jgi:hypothetical protein